MNLFPLFDPSPHSDLLQKLSADSLADDPITLIDIGTKGGISKRWSHFEHVSVLGFEPNTKSYRNLSDKQKEFVLNRAVWNGPQQTELYVTRSSGLSSLRKPNEDLLNEFPEANRFDIVDTETVQTIELDTAVKESPFRPAEVDFLKLDTQGTEYEILQSGMKTIDGPVIGMQVEVAFEPIYRGQHLFYDVDRLLRDHGFRLIDLKRIFWKRNEKCKLRPAKGQLIPGDTLYLRDPATFIRSLKDANDINSQAKVLKYVTVCLIYGYPDIALNFLSTAGEYDLIDNQTHQQYQNKIQESECVSIFDKGRYLIFRILSKMGCPYNSEIRRKTGRVIDSELGNR